MKILVIGCGKMGSAMIKAWLKIKKVERIDTVSPSGKTPFAGKAKVTSYKSVEHIAPPFSYDCIVYAAKPQQVAKILPSYTAFANCLFMSVAASVDSKHLQKYLGNKTPIVRVMPNTACSIGQGVSVFYANTNVTAKHYDIIHVLLSKMGMFWHVKEESLLHVATAVSGSGIAYVFYLMEVMTQVATNLGVDKDMAKMWTIQTVLGASHMAKQSPKSLEYLRKDVCSPNGVTEQALRVLMREEGLQHLMQETMEAAFLYSQKLTSKI